MYRTTRTLLMSISIALLVVPIGLCSAQNSRGTKPTAGPSAKNNRAKSTRASTPKPSSSSRVSGSFRNLNTAAGNSKNFSIAPPSKLNNSRVKPQTLNRLSKPPSNLNPIARPGFTNKLPANLRPAISGKLPSSVKPGISRLTPGVASKLPSSIRPAAFGELNRVGTLKGIANYKNVLEKAGKKDIKPIKLEKFDPKLNKLIRSTNFQQHASAAAHARHSAIVRLQLHGGCHWWIDFVIGSHWNLHHHGWWDICVTPGYWSCWTPCHYNVVYCPPAVGYARSAWYFGVDCILIPDLAAYGIQEVKLNSPAERAGLKQGDLIVSINGYAIESETVMRDAIQSSGGRLELGVIRDGNEQPVLVEVALQRVLVTSH